MEETEKKTEATEKPLKRFRDQFHGSIGSAPTEFRSVYPKYDFVADDHGKLSIEKVGEEDVDAKIQAMSVGSSLQEQLDLCMKTGDVSFLNVKNGSYVDLTQLPQSWEEVQNLVNNTDNVLKELYEKSKDFYKGSESGFKDYLLSGDYEKDLKVYAENLNKKEGDQK